MDNFNLRTFLAEGKLHEETEALDRESVIDFAQMVADEFTEEDANVGGTHMIYKVGKVDGLEFELDTQATENTPADDAKYGTGEGWGGSFRIEVLPNGYEIRNSEKGGLVATMDMEDGFRMLSADESRAELEGEPDVDWKNDELDMKRMEEGEEEVKENKPSNKMKKSELKEMIKMAMLEDARTDAEQEGYKDGFEDAKDDIEDKLKDMKVSEAEDVEVEDDENVDVKDTENVDVDIEKDIEVDDKESEVDIDVKASMPGESEDVEEVQALLMKAQEAAEALGDEKLTDQIGNTITYFTRSHVARNVSEMDDMDVNVNTTEMEAELGLEEAKDEEVKENLNESVVFPMWNRIK